MSSLPQQLAPDVSITTEKKIAIFRPPPAISEGDQAAIIAPSAGLASLFTHLRDLGVERLAQTFQLRPELYPSMSEGMSVLHADPELRARDINRAFADPAVKLVVCSIGGYEMIRVLPFLDLDTIRRNPKALTGFSDVTNLHLVLWKLGIVSYYGGNLLCQFAMFGGMHDYTVEHVRDALFGDDSRRRLRPSEKYQDGYLEWSDPTNINKSAPQEDNKEGWIWHVSESSSSSSAASVTGRLWGGCVDSLFKGFAARSPFLPTAEELDGAVLFVETSEIMPEAGQVYDFFAALGELGIIARLKAILVGRPKCNDRGRVPHEGRAEYRANQRDAVLRALADYDASPAAVIFNLDFGHTDPQILVPSGSFATIDVENREIYFDYSRGQK